MQPENNQDGLDKHLQAALNSVLNPLVTFLLRRGFTYPGLIQLLRKSYVEIAEQEGSLDGKPPTTSRISLLTGIARRYVKEIRQSGRIQVNVNVKIPPGAKLIAEWTSNTRFLAPDATPLCLGRLAENPQEASFEELARIASKDIRPRTQLDCLVERGLVKINDDDKIELLSQAYLPDTHKDEMLSVMGQHLHDHIASATGNVVGTTATELDRSAYQEGLSEASIAELKALSEKEGMKMLQIVYARASELAAKDEGQNDHRFRLGLYTYTEELKNNSYD